MSQELTNDQLIDLTRAVSEELSTRAKEILLERMNTPEKMSNQGAFDDPLQRLHLAIVNVVPMLCCTVEMALEWVVKNLPKLLKLQDSFTTQYPDTNIHTYVPQHFWPDLDLMIADKARMDYLEKDAEGRHTDGKTLRQRVDDRMAAEKEVENESL